VLTRLPGDARVAWALFLPDDDPGYGPESQVGGHEMSLAVDHGYIDVGARARMRHMTFVLCPCGQFCFDAWYGRKR